MLAKATSSTANGSSILSKHVHSAPRLFAQCLEVGHHSVLPISRSATNETLCAFHILEAVGILVLVCIKAFIRSVSFALCAYVLCNSG